MKIYTKTGDKGSTSLFGGSRVSKHHIRIESYGTLDELNSWLGLIRDQKIDEKTKSDLTRIQSELFTLGAELATEPEKSERLKIETLGEKEITFLENAIDQMNEALPPMTHFILPGGHATVSYCHLARTVCRRAERRMSMLDEQQKLSETSLAYVNRLSDYLFVLSRHLSASLGAEEARWISGQ
jgi:cob(I)alamin adenosyltransferase